MKYNLSVEMTPEETREIIEVIRDVMMEIRSLRKMARGPAEVHAPPPSPYEAPHPSEMNPPADGEMFEARESRQADTPDAYGEPLEFKVKKAATDEELLKAWNAWSHFLDRWCSPFSVDPNDLEPQYPNRAKIIEAMAGTLEEGRIKQFMAHHGTMNAAVHAWLLNFPWGPEHFSADDRTADPMDLADRISGSIAQLASILMPEFLVLYDISPSWRKAVGGENA